MLSACGGGGHGGHGGYIPPSTLPDRPQTEQDPCAINPETCMTTEKFSNAEKRMELYENAKDAGTSVATFSSRRKAKAVSRDTDGFADVDTAYKTMKDLLIDGNKATSADDLRRSLLLAGFSADDLSNIEMDLGEWAEINSNEIKNKAQIIWNMYGEEKEVSVDNARLTMANIDAIQDSYLSFTVDSNGKITDLQFDIDSDRANSRSMNFTKISNGKFERTGDNYRFEVKIPEIDKSIELELVKAITSKEDFATVKNILKATLYEEYDNVSQESLDFIDNLTFENFKSTDGVEYEGGVSTNTIEYTSNAKDIGEKGLQYSDFGTVIVNGKEGDLGVKEAFVFAGGYDAKRINPSKDANMTFEGDAIATAIYQHYSQNKNGNMERDDEQFAIHNGKAKLVFDKGQETLTTTFNDWYDVKVEGSNQNYNITFTGGEKIKDDSLFKYTNEANTFTKGDFLGNKGGNNYGAVDFGYYGDNENPTEAAGFVAFGQEKGENQSLHTQIGFGAQRTK